MSVSFLGAQAAQSGGISLSRALFSTSGTTSHVKSAWTQLIASTTYPAAWVLVECKRLNQPGDALFDIGVGAGGVEQVIIPNVPFSINSITSQAGASYLFPLFIPAGSRISVRHQNNAALACALDVQVTLFAPMFGGERGLGQAEACGANTGTSLGTSVDPGGTSNTKGTPVQLIAATTFPYKWVCVSINHTNVQSAAISWTVDIMVGAGGSEVVVVPDLALHSGLVADTNPAIGLCFPCSIPAGTRVAARAQSSSITSPDRTLEIVVHGVG